MRFSSRSAVVATIALTATAVVPIASASSRHNTSKPVSPHGVSNSRGGVWSPSYYVALGDSLAAGYQPGKGDNKTGGYVGGVYNTLKKTTPGLRLANLGCSGETSATFINGSRCSYGADGRSQLKSALSTLSKIKGHVKLVTLDIGANDVQTCVSKTGDIDYTCIANGLAAVAANLPNITKQLRTAVGPDTRIVLLNYYNPFLVTYLQGGDKKQVAQLSSGLQGVLNAAIGYGAATGDGQVADVAGAFDSLNWFTMVKTSYGILPQNVANICNLTYMCAKGDIHANDTGYAVLTKAVLAELRK